MMGRRWGLLGLILSVPLLAGCDLESVIVECLADAQDLPPWQIATLLGLVSLISEDLACVSGGVLAAREVVSYVVATLGCLLGIWFGDVGLYGLGRLGHGGLLKRAPFRWFISEERVEQGRQLFESHGGKLVFTSRFLPGSRLPIYVAAGLVRYSFVSFAGYMAIACVLWTPILVWLSMKVGDALLGWMEAYQKHAWIVFLGVIGVIWLVTRALEFGVTHRGRRLLFSKWSRLKEWEFWPMWVFYPPIMIWLIWLGFRHRCFTLFTLANPGIPQGGLALESKSGILKALCLDGKRDDRVARFELLPPGDPRNRLTALEDFCRNQQVVYPLILKPDVGERGQGVAIVTDASEAKDYLTECIHPVIAQELVEGIEFGVFYVRRPGAEKGEILSITEKVLPSVTGDGKKTLEELILNDARAVKMANFFLGKWTHHLAEIPDAGEEIRLTDLGTHCRGAVFLDGRGHGTEALRDAIEALSRQFDGFQFGRYDVIVSTVEDLEAGRAFKAIELNGVTSESTHIYSPGYSLFRAWRDLREQWSLAFAIGADNRARGLEPATIGEIWRVLRAHGAHEWFETPPKAKANSDAGTENR